MIALEKIPENQRAKLSVEDFLLLADSGAFDDYSRTELIEGEIWVVNAVHRRHARIHIDVAAAVVPAVKALGAPLVAYTNPATRLSDDSLPEPDIAIGEDEDGRVVTLAKLRLAIEISDSTLSMDLGRKARLYARTGVPEYWVVDCEAGTLLQMWAPEGETYREQRHHVGGERLSAATIPGLTIDLPDLS